MSLLANVGSDLLEVRIAAFAAGPFPIHSTLRSFPHSACDHGRWSPQCLMNPAEVLRDEIECQHVHVICQPLSTESVAVPMEPAGSLLGPVDRHVTAPLLRCANMFQLKAPCKYVRHQRHHKDHKEHPGNTLERLDDGPIDLQGPPLRREDQNLFILSGVPRYTVPTGGCERLTRCRQRTPRT